VVSPIPNAFFVSTSTIIFLLFGYALIVGGGVTNT